MKNYIPKDKKRIERLCKVSGQRAKNDVFNYQKKYRNGTNYTPSDN
jgi:hypothetical protein